MNGFMTELGKKTYAMVRKYGLESAYDPMSGHIIIAKDEMDADTFSLVAKFLENNTDWCMGYGEEFFYISPRADLV